MDPNKKREEINNTENDNTYITKIAKLREKYPEIVRLEEEIKILRRGLFTLCEPLWSQLSIISDNKEYLTRLKNNFNNKQKKEMKRKYKEAISNYDKLYEINKTEYNKIKEALQQSIGQKNYFYKQRLSNTDNENRLSAELNKKYLQMLYSKKLFLTDEECKKANIGILELPETIIDNLDEI